ncbi:MAG: c-type cytochrome [Nitrospirota bacterium]
MSRVLRLVAGGLLLVAGSVQAAERSMMQPRVFPDELAEARALKSPLPDSTEVVENGKALYEGKGTCVNCHGKDGMGNGPAAAGLDPSPRNFHHHGFWRHRTEGEIFWSIKHGIAGTAMIPFGGVLTDEEIWSIISYERSFAGDYGRGRPMGPREGKGHRGPRKGIGPREGGCCERPESAQ